MLAPTLPHSRRPQQRRVRRGVGPTTATVEDTVASVDSAVDLDGQGQVLGAETEPADEAEWPYDWRKQLRVALCGEHFRQFKRGNPPPSFITYCVPGGIFRRCLVVGMSSAYAFLVVVLGTGQG